MRLNSVMVAPQRLACEHQREPLGIDEPSPRLSWQSDDPRRGAGQTAYQIMVATSPQQLDEAKPDMWDTGRMSSAQSVGIVYAGRKLRSERRYFWKVRVWDQSGQPSPWSESAWWEMGLLRRSEWMGAWITGPQAQPCPLLRRKFRLGAPIIRARIYVTARGLFELQVNGKRVGRDELVPGWTDFHRRLQYLTYDVTALLDVGENVVGATLADGWYCGHLGWLGERNHYGTEPSLLLQLVVEDELGARTVIASDGQWRGAIGPLIGADLYDGETYDATRELPGWGTPTFDDAHWASVRVLAGTRARIVAKRCPPVRIVAELRSIAQSEPKPGVYIFDLGQNMVGRVRLKVQGPRGSRVQLRHGEMLQADGTLYTANLRRARATDVYVLKGDSEEIYEPRFTFHGFRFVELTGLAQHPAPDAITGVVLHTDLQAMGTFECSNPLVNQLQHCIIWSQKGNFLEVPTDCPQRNERLGWTGDAQIFVPTAAFNMDVARFFEKWCDDLADAQRPNGAFPHVAPDVLHGHVKEAVEISDGIVPEPGAAAWADAGVICPWTIYLHYGDPRILERNYEPMRRWIEFQRRTSRSLIRPSTGFGDWLSADAAEPSGAPTPRDLIGTAYFHHTTRLFARIAGILGRRDDARRYTALARDIKAAFNREFVTPEGRVLGDVQTGYLLALAFDLLPAGKRRRAAALLVENIERHGNHLRTGFVGTPLLAPVLDRIGRSDVAYRLLLQRTYPAWLYPVLQGATTMWERWNSWTKESGFGPAEMNSFNHYGYGSVGQWLYATVAGLNPDPDEPGYKNIVFRPVPGGGLTWAKAELHGPYGRISATWRRRGARLIAELEVPANSQATVLLPLQPVRHVGAGHHRFIVSCR